MRQGVDRIRGILSGMKARCNNPKNKAYNSYGGKGIKVCEEWSHGSKAFIEWSLKNGYADDLSIDRIDNNKGYEPSNCRWATSKQQANNHLYNYRVVAFGLNLTAQEWSDLVGIDRKTLRLRLQNGMTPELAVTHPLMKNGEIYKELKPIPNVDVQTCFNEYLKENFDNSNYSKDLVARFLNISKTCVEKRLSNKLKWKKDEMRKLYSRIGKISYLKVRSANKTLEEIL